MFSLIRLFGVVALVSAQIDVIVTLDKANSQTSTCEATTCGFLSGSSATISQLVACQLVSPTDCKIAFTTTGSYTVEQCPSNTNNALLNLAYTGNPNTGITSYKISVSSTTSLSCTVEVVESTLCSSEDTAIKKLEIAKGSTDTVTVAGPIITLRSTDDCVAQITTSDLSVAVTDTLTGLDLLHWDSATSLVAATTLAGVLYMATL